MGCALFPAFRAHHGSDRSYTARKIGGLVFGLELYPAFASSKRFWRDLALTGEYATSVLLQSQTSDGQAIATHWYRYGGGLHVRFPLVRTGETPALGLAAGYGRWVFTFDSPPARPQPTADYQLLRGQVDGELELGRVTVSCALSYLHLLSVGQLGERGPSGTKAGAEARLGAFFQLAPWFRLGTTGAYTDFLPPFEATCRAQRRSRKCQRQLSLREPACPAQVMTQRGASVLPCRSSVTRRARLGAFAAFLTTLALVGLHWHFCRATTCKNCNTIAERAVSKRARACFGRSAA